MEWLTLAIWLFAFLVALPLSEGILWGRVSLGLQALAAGGGLALMVAYVAVDEPATLAWIALALAGVGLLATTVGAVNLVTDHGRHYAPRGTASAEERESGLAGVQLLLMAVALALTLAVALEIGTST